VNVSSKLIRQVCVTLAVLAVLILPGTALAYTVNVEPTSHLGGCIYRSEFQRGDQAVWLITVTDPATGAAVGKGIEVLVRAGKQELPAAYNERTRLWSAVLPITWDMPTGTLKQSVLVKDADGKVVSEWKPFYAANQDIVVVPGPMVLQASLEDPVSGTDVETVKPGTTVRLNAKLNRPVRADDLFALAKPERELTLKDKGAPVTDGATVRGLVGHGVYVPATGNFTGGWMAEVLLSFDAARETWSAVYTFPPDAHVGNYTFTILAEDAWGNRAAGTAGSPTVVLPPAEPGLLDDGRALYAGLAVAAAGLLAGVVTVRRGRRS
jgi:hypothetical protein